MTSFQQFPQLPLELRCQIWALSTPPRDLEICGRSEHLCEEAAEGVDEEDVPLLYFYARDLEIYAEDPVKYQDIRTRTPYALQACHESRAYLKGAGGYVQAFTGARGPDTLFLATCKDEIERVGLSDAEREDWQLRRWFHGEKCTCEGVPDSSKRKRG
ncbi:hypothetical protein PG993_009139 [Apiospora rasikravindrae]|uniref:2EXR domain-containing protein n=1 Tax=Apiospora rasikravindrae TaxID=990691 RepID=A0ABR1SKC6_9PEZI